MAVIGKLLHATHATAPVPYFTSWQGRGGNSGVFVADIAALNIGSGKVKITVQTKNTEDADDSGTGQDLGSFDDITSLPASPRTKYLSGFKELVRYKIEVFGSPDDNWVHMRMLSPSWLWN